MAMSHGELAKVLRYNLNRALRANELEKAEALLEQLKNTEPLAMESRGLELDYLLRKQEWAAAAKLAQQLVSLFPGSGRIQFLAGQAAYRQKNYAAAVQCFRESMRLFPHNLSQQWLAKTLTQLGEFDEAESLLIALAENSSKGHLDLAWLYERKQQYEQALECLARHLEAAPDDAFALAQQQRLRAKRMQPEHLVAEVETLLEYGEVVADEILPEYLERLFATGQTAKARLFIGERSAAWSAKQADRIAWVCHKMQAYDLAYDLFLVNFAAQRRNFKYLNALEACAKRCLRVAALIAFYEQHAAEERALYGRARSLQQYLPSQ